MKKSLLVILLLLVFQGTYAQPFGMGGVNWLPDGNSYTTIEKYSIVKTTLPALTKSVLFDMEKAWPKDEAHPRTISSFSLSKDMNRVH